MARRSFVARPRRDLGGTLSRARPFCREEEDFVRAFAAMLNHATVAIAADPETPHREGSVAERVRKAYSGAFSAEQQQAIRRRAETLLSAPVEVRRGYFGAYAEAGIEAHAGPGLSAELKAQLPGAVQARLDAQRGKIAGVLSDHAAIKPSTAGPSTSKTWVEVGHFGDVWDSWHDLTINSPSSLDFHWGTNAPGAERGVWQLVRAGQQELQLASGKAGDAPGGFFSIDLAQYLPQQPPNAPAQYLVRVTPGTKPKWQPSDDASGPGLMIPGKAVGPQSDPVVITYSSVTAPQIYLNIFDVYKTAVFTLESIHMIQESEESGTEEFHIAGFVQETLPTSSDHFGDQKTFAKYTTLNPDGPTWQDLSSSVEFYLGSPLTPDWPRAYTAVISILEEDDGGTLGSWQASIATLAQDLASGDIADAVRDYLDENFEDYMDDINQLVNAGAEVAQLVASIVGSTTAAIGGMVIAAAALIISAVIASLPDDYYGTEAYVLVLPSNSWDYVHSLPGQITSYGGWQLDSETIEFKGQASWPDAAAWDGMVGITVHWTLRDTMTVSG